MAEKRVVRKNLPCFEKGRLTVFLSIKFTQDEGYRKWGETLIGALEKAGVEVLCLVEEEKWGACPVDHPVREAYRRIDQSDFLIVDATGGTGFGMGTEVGYATARGKPVVLICPQKTKLKLTREDAADVVIKFKTLDDLSNQL